MTAASSVTAVREQGDREEASGTGLPFSLEFGFALRGRRRPLTSDSRLTYVAELDAVEAHIWSLLDPYRRELDAATIYGMPSLRWPGAKAHDYFAAVRAGKSYVSLYLLVADSYPDALAGTPENLLKRRSGKATFNFPRLDDEMARDLATLLARLYVRYRADHLAG